MKLNSSTTERDSLYKDFLKKTGSNESECPFEPDFLREADLAVDEVTDLILAADNTWEYDDSNADSSELIDISTTLVSGTSQYPISTPWLKILRVRVSAPNGQMVTLKSIQRRELTDAQLAENGTPYGYDKMGNLLILVGIPNYGGTIEVQFQRPASYFNAADPEDEEETPAGDQEPPFARMFHRLISLISAENYLTDNGFGQRAGSIATKIDRMKERLEWFYGNRDHDQPRNLGVHNEDYGASMLA